MSDKKPVPPAIAESGEQAAIDLTVQNVEILRARVSELEAHVTRLGKPYVEMRAQLEQEWCQVRAMSEALKNYQPRAGVVDERDEFEAWRVDNFCGGIERLKKCSNAPDVYYYTAEQEAWRAWQARARLNPCRAQAVPDGWVLVPGEPTVEMLDAGYSGTSKGMDDRYKAMLAAAPSANSEQAVPDGFERYRLAAKFCAQRGIEDGDQNYAIIADAFASGFWLAAAPSAKKESDDEN